mgnify:CR=1 FL=1
MKNNIHTLAIDASFIASGGAINHLVNLISHSDNSNKKFTRIIILAPRKVLLLIPNQPYIIKNTNSFLNGPKIFKIIWCIFFMKKELVLNGVGLLYGLNGINFSRFKYFVGLSQNLLPFVPGQISNHKKFPLTALKLIVIKRLQLSSYNKSSGYVFLTNYSQSIFNKFSLKSSTVIPHGINPPFTYSHDSSDKNATHLVYVSPIDLYKNHANVIQAVSLYNQNHKKKIVLHLVGGFGSGFKLALSVVRKFNMNSEVIFYGQLLPADALRILGKMNASIFASSCESFPITILETIILKLPLLCSNVRPMTDILGRNAVFFDPLCMDSIYKSLLSLNDIGALKNNVHGAYKTALKYDWKIVSSHSFDYLYNIYKKVS